MLAIEDDGSIHLVRQYRPTVGAAMSRLPAGASRKRPPLEAARRELEEEAGLVAREWISLGAIWPLDGVVRHRIHHFVARGLSPRATAHETFEDITVHRLRDELRRMIAGGELVDGVALALLARWAAREGEG
ncbi:MAG: NUDIX domain-containing protein [Planctomycetota bacterium]